MIPGTEVVAECRKGLVERIKKCIFVEAPWLSLVEKACVHKTDHLSHQIIQEHWEEDTYSMPSPRKPDATFFDEPLAFCTTAG